MKNKNNIQNKQRVYSVSFDAKTTQITFQLQEQEQKHQNTRSKNRIGKHALKQHYTKNTKKQGKQRLFHTLKRNNIHNKKQNKTNNNKPMTEAQMITTKVIRSTAEEPNSQKLKQLGFEKGMSGKCV